MSSTYGAIDSASWTDYAQLLEHTQKRTGKGVVLGTRDVPVLTSCRWVIAYVCFTGSVVVMILQQDMSMALVCMFPPNLEARNSSQPNRSLSNFTLYPIEQAGEFDWTGEVQGMVLSAQFYGAMVSPIIGGYIATHYGGKQVLTVTTIIAILTTLLTPPAAWVSPWLVVVLRVILGLAGGVFNPAVQALLTEWAPVYDRAKMVAFCFSGVNLGNMVAYSISGVLCTVPLAGGWPLIFYIFGASAVAWIFFLLLCVYNSPDQHPRITELERHYIISGLSGLRTKKPRLLPWKRMIRSLPVWACVIGQFVNIFCVVILQANVPMYMRDVLRFSTEEIGLFNTIPAAGRLVGVIVCGFLSDFIVRKRTCSLNVTRKLFLASGFLLPAAALCGLGFLAEDQNTSAVILLTIAGTTSSAGMVTLRVNLIDIAPRYASILMGILMTVTGIAGIISPLCVTILTSNGTREEWQVVFFICTGVYVLGTLLFVALSSSNEQAWSVEEEDSVALLDEQSDAKNPQLRNSYVVTNKLVLPGSPQVEIRKNSIRRNRGVGQTFLESDSSLGGY